MKGTYYFQHDFNARKDPKLINVMIRHGLSGIGAFWCIVEMLFERGGRIPIDEYNCISFELHIDIELIKSVINDFGLFHTDGKTFWSESVLRRLDRRNAISDKRKAAIAKRWQSAETIQENNNDDTIVIQTDTNIKYKKENKKTSTKVDVDEGKTAQRFLPPTLEEIKDYISEKGYTVDAERFFDFYESKGWFVGKNKMKDWRAAVRNWQRGEKKTPAGSAQRQRIEESIKSSNDEWT